MVNLMKMAGMVIVKIRDHGDLTAHPVNADKFGISPENYICLHGTEHKKKQNTKDILEYD